MLVGQVWLTGKQRGFWGEVVKWGELWLVAGPGLAVWAVSMQGLLEWAPLGNVLFSGPFLTLFPFANAAALGLAYFFSALVSIFGLHDIHAPEEPDAGTLRLSNSIHKFQLVTLVGSAVINSVCLPLIAHILLPSLRYDLQRAIRLSTHDDNNALHMDWLQTQLGCCGMSLPLPHNRSCLFEPPAIWSLGNSSLPESCFNKSSPKRSVYPLDCAVAMAKKVEVQLYQVTAAMVVALLGLVGTGVVGRLVRTSLWVAVWSLLDYDRRAPGFLFQLDTLRSRRLKPAFQIAHDAAAKRHFKEHLTRAVSENNDPTNDDFR